MYDVQCFNLQQVTMAHTYHSDTFSEIHGSSSYPNSNESSILLQNGKSVAKEKKEDMIIKNVAPQLNASINGNLGYEYYPAAPHDLYNHSLSNATKFGYNNISGK